MIPKILHHVWIGPNPLPDMEKSFINSWKKFHSDWRFMLWNNNTINNLEINNNCKEAIEKSGERYACQADVVRYIAVHAFGGVYVDTDVECFKTINDLINNKIDFLGLQPHNGNWITNAFFGAVKNSEVLKSAIANVRPPKKNEKNPHGPVFLTNHVRKNFNFTKESKIYESPTAKCSILKHDKFWSKNCESPYCKHLFKASWLND